MKTKKTDLTMTIRPNKPRGYCIDVYRHAPVGKNKLGPMNTEERYLARTIEDLEQIVSDLYRTGKTTV
jgi:hypothetical protein